MSAEEKQPTMADEHEAGEDKVANNGVVARAESERERFRAAKMDDFVVLSRYAFLVCMLSEMMILCQLSNMLYMVYAGAAPSLVSCGSKVFVEGETAKERCDYMTNTGVGNGTCTPDLKAQFVSVNYEFGYYCGTTKLVKQSISVQMIGVIVGSVIFGHLSDSYGRRKIMAIALIMCICFMIVSSFTNSLLWFTVWRFLVNLTNAGTMVILMVFVVENLPKKDRFWISNLITWSPNMVLYAVIAYFAGDWRTLTRVSALLAIPALGLLAFLCESPRYLVQSRRLDDAKAAVKRIHRIDGRVCDDELLDHVLFKEEQTFLESRKKKKYNFIHLFYTWTFTRYTVAVAFSLLVTSILNYSLLFNMEKLSGSLYWNSIIMGLFRYSCNLAIAFLDIKFEWIGRKFAHAVAQAFSFVALEICAFIFIMGYHVEFANVVRAGVLSVIGVCSLLYTTNGICSNELFPTCIRNTSFSFGQVWSRIGVVISPQIFLLGDFWLPFPYLLMGILAAADLLLFHTNVTETKGKPLTDNMPGKDQRLFSRDKNIELLPKNPSNKDIESPKDI
ncbi:sugar transporter domain-containing protein [Ditylenchus destructor]|uniref:Sugar transporter domain-containing protein n=1 Tax=Ditylenchus destructor TaxID=166010 RepID=A0AAD4N1D4_9BILA|nr:sugar transporter domain-containing protein [Ditylenchus destructor]